MALSWNAQADGDAGLVADRNLYLDASQNALVEEGDYRCASLLCGKGRAIYADEVKRLGLVVVDGRVVQSSNEPEAVGAEAPSTEEDEHGSAEG